MESVEDLVTGFPLTFRVLLKYCRKGKIAEGLPEDPELKENTQPTALRLLMGSQMQWRLNVQSVSGKDK